MNTMIKSTSLRKQFNITTVSFFISWK